VFGIQQTILKQREFLPPWQPLISTYDLLPALPGSPSNVRVSDIMARSVRLRWSYSGPEDPNKHYFVIQYKPKFSNQAFSEISGIVTKDYAVRDLSPYTEYELYVIAVNNVGRGAPSAPVVVTTGETGTVFISGS